MTTGDVLFLFLTLALGLREFHKDSIGLPLFDINLDVQFLNLPLRRALTVRQVRSTVIKIHSLHEDTTIFLTLKTFLMEL